MLLEDADASGIPSCVTKSLGIFKQPPGRFEILVGLVYYVCMEMGFVSAGDDEIELSRRITLPPPAMHATRWSYSYVNSIVTTYAAAPATLIEKQQIQQNQPPLDKSQSTKRIKVSVDEHNQTYTFTLKLLNFSDRHCLLLVRNVFSGNAMCVTICGDNCAGQSVMLPLSHYVRATHNNEDPKANDHTLLNDLVNMNEFAHKLKSIIVPVRNDIMNAEGQRFAALDGLPEDVLWLLLGWLDVKALHNLSCSCIRMRASVIDYIREMGRSIVLPEIAHTPMVPYREVPFEFFRNY